MRLAFPVACLVVAGCATGGGIERRMTGDAGPSDASGAMDAFPRDDAGPGVDAYAGDPCSPGATRFCTTPCDTQGISSCEASGFFGPCVPPVEDCNAMDDDCDGMVDESIAARMCSSACGGGTEQCVSGHWTGCTATTPGTETCNAMDDYCDGMIDDGLTRACSSACGSGIETCRAGAYVGCTAAAPRAETCNAMDDDCDGMIDESLTRSCANACGAPGTETCTGATYVGCTAPSVPVEICNGADDDCDGSTDEDLQVAIYGSAPTSQVVSYQTSCTGPGGAIDVCLTAAKRWCVSRAGCSVGGAGLLAGDASVVRVACFGDHASERTVSFATLASLYSPSFTEAMAGSHVASSYANRWCQAQGFAAGVGPVEHSAGTMVVDCLAADQAMVVSIPTADLGAAAGCNPVVSPDAFACNVASDLVCQMRGFRAGFGPVEWNTTDAAVVCFR